MTAANYAGLARFPLAFAAIWVLCSFDFPWRNETAAVLVVLAIVSDILDGVLSRHFDTVSDFGAILDFTADKVFVCPVLFLLDPTNILILWCAGLTTVREFLVMGVRLYAAGQGEQVPASRLGKLKAIVMYPALILVLLGVPGALVVLVISVVLAWVSGVDYVRNAWSLLEPGLFPNRFEGKDS